MPLHVKEMEELIKLNCRPKTVIFDVNVVGGTLIPIESTSLLLAGLQTSAIWLAPVVISAAGIGIVLVRRK